jgi:hypothetical protein
MNGFSHSFSARACQLGTKWLLRLIALGLLLWNFAAGGEIYPARIFSATQAVAAVTSADFDPIPPGNELACLMANGDVMELALGPSGWTAATIFRNPGSTPGFWENPANRATLEVGDVLSGNAGDELVISIQQEDQKQVLAVYYAPSVGWTNQIIADFSALLGVSWGARVGDCDPARAGEEIFCIFENLFDNSQGFVYRETNGVWESNTVYAAEVGMDAAIGDFNPDFAGNEIIVVTEMGPAYEIMLPVGGGPGLWPSRTIWNDADNVGWVVKIGDVDPESPGNEIVYGTRNSDRIMMSRHNGTNLHNVGILLTGVNTNKDLNNMLDVAIGQVFPASSAAEILGVDASGSVYAVQRVTNQWQRSVLWRDTNALYGVLAADLIPAPGDEVVVAGAPGTVTLLFDPAPILSVALTAEQHAVLSWNGVAGLTYAVETTTNLMSGSSWNHVTNLVHQGGFHGALSYTHAPVDLATKRWFRVRASW